MKLLLKCLIWYYEYILESVYALHRICQGFEYAIEYARVVNMPAILKVLNMREYALGECSNISEYL